MLYHVKPKIKWRVFLIIPIRAIRRHPALLFRNTSHSQSKAKMADESCKEQKIIMTEKVIPRSYFFIQTFIQIANK